jgi:hypothetical protein
MKQRIFRKQSLWCSVFIHVRRKCNIGHILPAYTLTYISLPIIVHPFLCSGICVVLWLSKLQNIFLFKFSLNIVQGGRLRHCRQSFSRPGGKGTRYWGQLAMHAFELGSSRVVDRPIAYTHSNLSPIWSQQILEQLTGRDPVCCVPVARNPECLLLY